MVYKERSLFIWQIELKLCVIIVITFYNQYSGFCIAREENNFQCWKFRIRALNKKATVN